MKAWLVKNKGYLIHAAAVAVVFLNPSVKDYLAHHLAYAGLGGVAWGWILHWATGK